MARFQQSATITLIVLLGAWSGAAEAEDGKPAPVAGAAKARPKKSQAKAAPKGVTVAVLPFDANDPGNPDLGRQIAETIEAVLVGRPGLRLVDRSKLENVFRELELNLTGAVATRDAVKVGNLVGARILVTGRAFPIGDRLILIAKFIGTETSLVDAVHVKGGADADIGDLVVELAEKAGERLTRVGDRLVASDIGYSDPLPALKKKLAGATLPTVAVVVTEGHFRNRPTRVIDPACETEIKRTLRHAGVKISDVRSNELTKWARRDGERKSDPWPRDLRDVDLVITGEAFSEFATRIGSIVSCIARAEVNVIHRKDGNIEIADRVTARAVDLSEQIAGKKALQKTGHIIAIRILRQLAKQQPADGAPSP
ncbi:MAG: hypothetical protein CMJ18_05400 [Phycisphaeraceae bacterium]|nr:hypothetical protein [Phycisphaeraceae bacterium]